jgi:hypothetical protein
VRWRTTERTYPGTENCRIREDFGGRLETGIQVYFVSDDTLLCPFDRLFGDPPVPFLRLAAIQTLKSGVGGAGELSNEAFSSIENQAISLGVFLLPI